MHTIFTCQNFLALSIFGEEVLDFMAPRDRHEGSTMEGVSWRKRENGDWRAWCFFLIHPRNLWDSVVAMVCRTPERKVFSYNKRTMDWAMGPF
jgi:hypothetical protein